ncbi:MAG: DUF1294 domain-containing protein [Lachnospiraceae bacterium]
MISFLRENPAICGVIYLLLVNIIGFALMGIDKSKARKNKWRIPEKTLFFVAILGGSIGCVLGMKLFRHKTKHNKFVYGMPAILAFQVMMAAMMIVQFIKVS